MCVLYASRVFFSNRHCCELSNSLSLIHSRSISFFHTHTYTHSEYEISTFFVHQCTNFFLYFSVNECAQKKRKTFYFCCINNSICLSGWSSESVGTVVYIAITAIIIITTIVKYGYTRFDRVKCSENLIKFHWYKIK